MRVPIVHPGAGELQYEIRGIVSLAHQLAATGLQITWENIGDPVAKGEQVPEWIRQLVADEALHNNLSYGYSPTKGLDAAREYLARTRSLENGAELKPENIIFFNGLGDAITKVYTWLNPTARVLGPNPAYPTHSSIEGAHGRSLHMTYTLDPNNGWLPDVEDVRRKIEANPNITALLVINPDNPTGMVYPREILQVFVDLAKEFKLFLIADEIYAKLAFEDAGFVSLASLADGVPTIIMRGLSKEVPWPGSRCGWLEFYNLEADADFGVYAKSIEEAKMTEVCSTTLPQSVLPKLLGDERYQPHLKTRRDQYYRRAQQATNILSTSPHLRVVQPKGAFYLSVTFADEFLQRPFSRPAANPEAQQLLDHVLADVPAEAFDKRFCYQLLAATGICTVPLSTGFNSHIQGFRMTLLESNDQTFEATLRTIVDFVANSK